MFEIIKHGPRLFEERGRVEAGELSQVVRSRQAATQLAARCVFERGQVDQ